MAVTNRASRPVFSRAANSPSVKDYLAQLDELLKRNKGGFSAVAEETGSSVPFILPGRAVKSAVPELASQRQAAELPQPEEYPVQPLDPMTGEVQGEQAPAMSVGEFVSQISQTFGTAQDYLAPVSQNNDGSVQLSDGSTVYSDGTMVTRDGNVVQGMASMVDGGVLYSDGSVRYFDPSITGIEGFSQGLFGQNLDVTQPFGNQNPELGYGEAGHLGTDLRTRNLENKAFTFPINTQVLQIISAESGSPYGNSVLLQLPTGEAIRLSHLADLGDFTEGATIPAGTYIGTTGNTGRSTAEHLDVEYYNKDGQLSDLSTFSGFSQPSEFAQYVAPKEASMAQPAQPQPEMQTTQPSAGMTKLQEAAQALGYSPDASTYTPKQRSDVALTSMGFNPEGTIGFQEALAGDFPAAGRELSQTIERVNPTPRIDLGISEALRGDLPGARQQFTSTMQRAGNRLSQIPGQIKDAVINPAYAGDGEQPRQSLGENLQYIGSKVGEYAKEKAGDVLGVAGAGVEKLKSGIFSKGGAGVNLFSRPQPSTLNQQRAVGDVSGGSSLLPASFADAKSAKLADRPNDIRDPFFKTGADKAFSQYINPQAAETGALSLDLFSPEFYGKASNIGQVFAGTQFEQPAQQRYIEAKKAEFLRRYGDPSQYDQGDVQSILRALESGKVGQEVQLAQPRRVVQQTGGDAGMNVSSGQYASQPQEQREQQSAQRTASYATGNIGQQLSQPRQAPAPQPVYGQNYTELMRQATPAPQPPQQNIFQKAATGVSNLFKKWFQ